MDINSGLAAIDAGLICLKGISNAVKAIKELDQKIFALEFREQLVDLKEKLLEAREATLALISENQNLRSQVQVKEVMQLQEDGNILWRIEDSEKRGPYCSTCFGSDEKVISLSGNNPGEWHCPKCKNHFSTKDAEDKRRLQYKELNRSPCY